MKRYRLIVRLGTGGMAEVYLAVTSGASGSNKLHVLKVLRRDVSPEEHASLLQMFEDEGRLAVRLNHPHIIQSHDVDFEAGYHFIAMEYLEGQPFDLILKRSEANASLFPLQSRLFVLTQVLEALEYAHNLTDYDGTPLGIVHRDVSPQNVFVLYTGHTKLLDFGVAKTFDSNKTQAGVVKGKVGYMAPEQLAGTRIDARADLFSVGVMLWEAIAGRRMHADRSVLEIVKLVAEGSLPKLREAVPDVPDPLERIVSRALAFKPEDRYPDARSLRNELLALPLLTGTSARDVGDQVDALFTEERRALNEKIREAMRSAKDRGSIPDRESLLNSVSNPDLARPVDLMLSAADVTRTQSSTKSSSTAPTTLPLGPRALVPETTIAPASQRTQSLRLARSRLVRWAGVGLGISALVVYLMSKAPTPAGSRLAASASDNRVAAAGPASVTSASSPEVAKSVEVRLTAHPREAALVLDGIPVPENPYTGVHPRDRGTHVLEVSAAGYLRRNVSLDFSQDVNETIRLELAPPSATSATPPVSATAPATERAPAAPVAASAPSKPPRATMAHPSTPMAPPNPYARATSGKTTDPRFINAVPSPIRGKSSTTTQR